MTQPDVEPQDRDELRDPDDAGDVFEPNEHPHPLRAQDCEALIEKQVG